MKWIKRVVYLVVVVCGIILGGVLGLENEQAVALQLYGFPAIQAPLGLLILVVLVIGTLLGFLVSLVAFAGSRRQVASLKRTLKQRDTELERLRQAPLQSV